MKVKVYCLEYLNKNLAIDLFEVNKEGEETPVATLTKDFVKLPKPYAVLDINKYPWAERFIVENNFGKPTGQEVKSGFTKYPIDKFNIGGML